MNHLRVASGMPVLDHHEQPDWRILTLGGLEQFQQFVFA